jgi:hypothetical protein
MATNSVITSDWNPVTATIDELPHNWKRWVAENKFLGTDDPTLIKILMTNGFAEPIATREVLAIVSDPYFQAGQWMVQRLKKLESFSDMRNGLRSLSPRNAKVERRRNVPRQVFLENYYAENRPVILLDLTRDWKALSLWNPEYLRAKCGNEIVQIMRDRDSDPLYEVNSETHKQPIPFSEYVDLVTLGGRSNDYYLVANNSFLDKPSMQWVFDDIEFFPEYLDPAQRKGMAFFWFGPAGTVTPLHHDKSNILLAQVYGRKQVTLIPPDQTHLLYNDIAVFSKVDLENPDYDTYPLYKNVTKVTITLHPGEVLFLPVGWWHHVRALDISINVSFLNFVFPNYYQIPDMDVHR